MKKLVKASSYSYKKYIVKYYPEDGWYIYNHDKEIDGPFASLARAEDKIDELNRLYKQ